MIDMPKPVRWSASGSAEVQAAIERELDLHGRWRAAQSEVSARPGRSPRRSARTPTAAPTRSPQARTIRAPRALRGSQAAADAAERRDVVAHALVKAHAAVHEVADALEEPWTEAARSELAASSELRDALDAAYSHWRAAGAELELATSPTCAAAASR